jgi:hypothetical protein
MNNMLTDSDVRLVFFESSSQPSRIYGRYGSGWFSQIHMRFGEVGDSLWAVATYWNVAQ